MIASVILVAAGSSKRMGGGVNKPYLDLDGRPVIFYSLSVFSEIPEIKEIIAVIREQDRSACEKIVKKYNFKKVRIEIGGKERQDSVFNGIKKLRKDCSIVLIHDSARPFITKKLILKLIEEAGKHKAVIPVVPAKDTVKRSDNGITISNTLDRKILYLAQTPQVFSVKIIKEAYEEAHKAGFRGTDDSMMVERLGKLVRMTPGDEKNVKITMLTDL